jgi:hypothetical protein
MLQILHKILALILALAVLFSTLSFTVEKHVCMGEVTDVSYFDTVESCGMETTECGDDLDGQEQVKRTNCCDTLQELIPGDPVEQQAIQGLEIQEYGYIVSYISSFLLEYEPLDLVSVIEYGPDPPLVERDIQTLYQTFLI